MTVSESAGMVKIVIHRVGPPRGRAPAIWWVEAGSARENDDYGKLGINLETFAEGETSREIYLPIVADSLPEPPESFYVNLPGRSGQGVKPQGNVRMRVTIVDDDD